MLFIWYKFIKNIEVLSLYKSLDEVFDQICDSINTNEQLKIESTISIQSSKAILTIPINSRKYKQISFELKYEISELVEILLDTVDKLIKKKYRIWKKNKSFRRKSICQKRERNNSWIWRKIWKYD